MLYLWLSDLNPFKVVKRVVWLAAMLTLMCVAVAAQPLNVNITEYPIPTGNAVPLVIRSESVQSRQTSCLAGGDAHTDVRGRGRSAPQRQHHGIPDTDWECCTSGYHVWFGWRPMVYGATGKQDWPDYGFWRDH